MRTSFEFIFIGNELYGRDGRALTPVFDEAIEDAELIARLDPRLEFEPPRRRIERGELDNIKDMRNPDAPNTLIAVSDFPIKVIEARRDIGGYNYQRRQTFLRVITRTPEGKIRLQSQSLDLSDRTALEQIYAYFGRKPKPGELLGQRIKVNLSSEDQESLIDRLTGVYDQALSAQYGDEWYAGRRPVDRQNTYDFVKTQHDLLDFFAMAKVRDFEAAERLRYGIAATMKQRFNNRHNTQLQLTETSNILQEIQKAKERALMEGWIFSACGITVDEVKEAGYGNRSEVLKCVKCPLCKKDGVDAHIKYREDGKKTITCSKCNQSKTYDN